MRHLIIFLLCGCLPHSIFSQKNDFLQSCIEDLVNRSKSHLLQEGRYIDLSGVVILDNLHTFQEPYATNLKEFIAQSELLHFENTEILVSLEKEIYKSGLGIVPPDSIRERLREKLRGPRDEAVKNGVTILDIYDPEHLAKLGREVQAKTICFPILEVTYLVSKWTSTKYPEELVVKLKSGLEVFSVEKVAKAGRIESESLVGLNYQPNNIGLDLHQIQDDINTNEGKGFRVILNHNFENAWKKQFRIRIRAKDLKGNYILSNQRKFSQKHKAYSIFEYTRELPPAELFKGSTIVDLVIPYSALNLFILKEIYSSIDRSRSREITFELSLYDGNQKCWIKKEIKHQIPLEINKFSFVELACNDLVNEIKETNFFNREVQNNKIQWEKLEFGFGSFKIALPNKNFITKDFGKHLQNKIILTSHGNNRYLVSCSYFSNSLKIIEDELYYIASQQLANFEDCVEHDRFFVMLKKKKVFCSTYFLPRSNRQISYRCLIDKNIFYQLIIIEDSINISNRTKKRFFNSLRIKNK